MAASLGLYHRRRTGEGVQVTTHLTWVAVLLQTLSLAEVQEKQVGDATSRGLGRLRVDTAKKIVAGMTLARDGWAVVVGPRGDVERWISEAGIVGASFDGRRINFTGRPLRGRSAKAWQASLERAGVGGRVLVVPSFKVKRFLGDQANVVRPGLPLVNRRPYPGCPKPRPLSPPPSSWTGPRWSTSPLRPCEELTRRPHWPALV